MKLSKVAGFLIILGASSFALAGTLPYMQLASGDPSMIPPPLCGPNSAKAKSHAKTTTSSTTVKVKKRVPDAQSSGQ